MLIRTAQVEALREAAARNFETEMLEHLRGFAPRLCEIRGDEVIRQVIRSGIGAAGRYGLDQRGPVRLYIDLMFSLGCHFDTDIQLPWAAAALKDESIPDQAQRAQKLYGEVCEYRAKVAGPDHAYVLEALKRARQMKAEDLDNPPGRFDDAIAGTLHRVYPQKYDHVREPAVRTLIESAIQSARGLSLASRLGAGLLACLMFAFGQGILSDPLYPWVHETLSDPRVPDPKERSARLYRKTMVYLDRVLADGERA
jgi:hypothetical protein